MNNYDKFQIEFVSNSSRVCTHNVITFINDSPRHCFAFVSYMQSCSGHQFIVSSGLAN